MSKLGRNDLCWCGSGLKYKSCHITFDQKLEQFKENGAFTPDRSLIKNKKQLDGIRESGLINTELLDKVTEIVKEGISTEEINSFIHTATIAKGAIPAPLNYKGFPKSLCTSINDQVCHGIPDKNIILKDGDIINIDVTTIYNGYYADASRMFLIGNVSAEAKQLVEVTKQCLQLGIDAVKPWGFLGDIGAVIGQHAKENGYSVVEEIGGHGVGNAFHEDPYVCHVGAKCTGMLLVPGMVFTIEPMINAGTNKVYQDKHNGWTIYTEDNALSAQWEHTIAVTETGIEILTY